MHLDRYPSDHRWTALRPAAAALLVIAFACSCDDGADGVVSTQDLSQSTDGSIGDTLAFVGSPVSVAVTEGQRMTGTVTVSVYQEDFDGMLWGGLCYQPASGSVATFSGHEQVVDDFSDAKWAQLTDSGTVAPAAGTYSVGLCLRVSDGSSSSTDATQILVDGWVQVTNG